MNKKHTMQIIVTVLLLSMMFSTVAFAMPPGQEKKLLKTQNEYEEAFNLMKDKRIMLGDGFGDYRLNDFVKRGDITVMIVRAFKLNMMDKPIEEEMKADDFLDLIDKNNYQYNFVKIAKHYKIAQGDGKNFYPDKFVSYDEAFALIERAVKVANSNVIVLNEKDEEVKLRDWYKEFVKDDEDAFNKSLKKLVNVTNYGDPATRGDIASMLYYVLTGNKDFDDEEDENEIEDIKLYWNDKTFKGLFENINFKDAFEEIEDKDYVVEYLKFDNMGKDEGELFYDYIAHNGDDNIKAGNSEYYFDNDGDKDKREVSDLTFVAGKENISYIEYTAYIYNEEDEKYDEYEGRIIISVADKNLARVRISTEETFDFNELYIKDFIEEIQFSPVKDVTIKINGKDLQDTKYGIGDIKEITVIPKDDSVSRVDINYTAYDDEMSYTGVIRVTINK